ncbi:hypothetical protein Dsin_016511 [Dipteronia sinensis]|uniref:Uncharacterized protein n=1 Tax=Dipteronia sinensis TaxID=43782 RepID=A0AAE0E623_9ROSI|nr:hypothetical protein Dsin_016511 [Dipteronia sinensis]
MRTTPTIHCLQRQQIAALKQLTWCRMKNIIMVLSSKKTAMKALEMRGRSLQLATLMQVNCFQMNHNKVLTSMKAAVEDTETRAWTPLQRKLVSALRLHSNKVMEMVGLI